MYVSKSEGANFWLNVLTDLQNRGIISPQLAIQFEDRYNLL